MQHQPSKPIRAPSNQTSRCNYSVGTTKCPWQSKNGKSTNQLNQNPKNNGSRPWPYRASQTRQVAPITTTPVEPHLRPRPCLSQPQRQVLTRRCLLLSSDTSSMHSVFQTAARKKEKNSSADPKMYTCLDAHHTHRNLPAMSSRPPVSSSCRKRRTWFTLPRGRLAGSNRQAFDGPHRGVVLKEQASR
jgi:hypothetical protein